MTSSVTMRPRRTGKQCMNLAWLVHDICPHIDVALQRARDFLGEA